MANIMDYLKWRGDLSFEVSCINEIDALILSRLSYFHFDGIVDDNEIITIEDAYNRYKKLGKSKVRVLQEEDPDLFLALAKSNRFSKLKVTNFINKLNPEQEKQFAAITIILPDNTVFVSFRGTDNTIVGWKEDLNMSFKENVPAQLDGVEYLKNVANTFPNNIIVGGHSKGGNVAIYSSIYCGRDIQDRITNIFNNDGPGVTNGVAKSEEYLRIIDKMHTFVPQSSVIGMLLSHEEKYTVVQSTQKGIMQHDLYTWQLEGIKFVELEHVNNGSVFIDKTIKTWLQEIDAKQRGEVINIIFEIIQKTQANTFSEVKSNWVKNAKILVKEYQNVSPQNKDMIWKTLNALWGIAKSNVKSSFFKPKNKEKLTLKSS